MTLTVTRFWWFPCLVSLVAAGGQAAFAQQSAAPSPQWKVEETKSEMSDVAGITLYLDAIAPITGAARVATTPTLVIRCHEGTLQSFVSVGRVLDSEPSGGSAVRVRFDTNPPQKENWTRSTDMLAVFAPDPVRFVRGPLVS